MLPYTEAGSGEAVVLLHAGIADRSMWDEHLEWLARAGFRAVAVDLPGFGEAPAHAGPHADWEDVVGTMRDLEINRATVVGNSFGAAVALRVAAVAPLAVRTLTAAGEYDMPDFIEGAEKLARTLPDARYVTIAGAGHLAPLETPEAFERLLREFLGGAAR
jgi:pimeloyl-ACP methyl ester carboxylesterase